MVDMTSRIHSPENRLDTNNEDAMILCMSEMVKQNAETRALLRELNSNMQKLVEVTSQQQQQQPSNSSDGSSLNGSAYTTTHDDSEDTIARTTVRLDGLEVYAVVSALTCATLYQCFESFKCDDLGRLYEEGHYVELFGDIAFLFSSATGVLAGLHATLVFSLMTMYGRTAIGMGRDDAFDTFFQKTGMIRFRGFQTFLWSLYAFLIQVGIVITSKVPKFSRTAFFLAVTFLLYEVHKDTESIIQKAGVLFVPPTPSATIPAFSTTKPKK